MIIEQHNVSTRRDLTVERVLVMSGPVPSSLTIRTGWKKQRPARRPSLSADPIAPNEAKRQWSAVRSRWTVEQTNPIAGDTGRPKPGRREQVSDERTKPIGREVGGEQGQLCPGVRKWARAGAGRRPLPSPVEQTNPIGPRHTHCSSIPSFQSIPIVRNKPNRAYTTQRTSTWSKRSYDESGRHRALEKQSQSAPGRGWGRVGGTAGVGGGRDLLCQTKPIRCRAVVRTKPIGTGDVAPNKANRPGERAVEDPGCMTVRRSWQARSGRTDVNRGLGVPPSGGKDWSDARKRGTPNGCGCRCKAVMHPRTDSPLKSEAPGRYTGG